jgi:hypothetical protein
MMIDVLLGAVVLLNAWLLSTRTTPLFPISRLRARMRTDEDGNHVSKLMR